MRHSRRGFIALSSMTALSAAMAKASARLGAGDLKLGIQMFSLRKFDLDAALQHAADAGFLQVEFYKGMLPIDASSQKIEAVKKKLDAHGLTMAAHGVNRFGKNAAENRKVFEFAKAIGIKNITADPDPTMFNQLDELVEEFDIRIAIHNHGPRHRYNKVVDVLHAIEGHDERIGACADLGHYIRSGENAVEVIRLLKGRLYGIHLKDFAEMKDKTEGVIIGKGHLDVGGVVDALIEVDFPADGALSLEYESNPNNPIADIRECFSIASSAIKKAKAARN